MIDASDPEYKKCLEVTESLLSDLGAAGKPTLYVFNKCDRGVAEYMSIGAAAPLENTVYISAKTGQGLSVLISKIEEILQSRKRKKQ